MTDQYQERIKRRLPAGYVRLHETEEHEVEMGKSPRDIDSLAVVETGVEADTLLETKKNV